MASAGPSDGPLDAELLTPALPRLLLWFAREARLSRERSQNFQPERPPSGTGPAARHRVLPLGTPPVLAFRGLCYAHAPWDGPLLPLTSVHAALFAPFPGYGGSAPLVLTLVSLKTLQ